MKKIMKIVYEAFLLFCALFTVGTLANSIGYLYFGIETNPDVHGHIMGRAGLMLVVTTIITLATNIASIIKEKRTSVEQSDSPPKVNSLLTYVIIWGIVLLLVTVFLWAFTSGHLWLSKDEFSPHSFWHLFRSTVIPGFAAAVIGFFVKKRRFRKTEEKT